jgi:hypothetical protein
MRVLVLAFLKQAKSRACAKISGGSCKRFTNKASKSKGSKEHHFFRHLEEKSNKVCKNLCSSCGACLYSSLPFVLGEKIFRRRFPAAAGQLPQVSAVVEKRELLSASEMPLPDDEVGTSPPAEVKNGQLRVALAFRCGKSTVLLFFGVGGVGKRLFPRGSGLEC